MAIGLVGQKCGMTRIFEEDGRSITVTVIQVKPNRVTQIKGENEGYSALQLASGSKKISRVTKPLTGHFKKAGVEPGNLREFRVSAEEIEKRQLTLGSEIHADYFSEGQMVDVSGTSKGKGFAGVVKRHNFRTQDATHGNSLSHRAPGSIGQNQTPGRVFKGKKMAGQLGNVTCTMQNLQIVRVDSERSLLLVKGSVPGHKGAEVVIKPAVKASEGVNNNG